MGKVGPASTSKASHSSGDALARAVSLGALNFLLNEALGGGGTLSLRIDAQGKTFSAALLRMEIEVNEHELTG